MLVITFLLIEKKVRGKDYQKKNLLVNNWFHGKNQKRQCTLSPKSSQNLKPTEIQLIETLSCFKKRINMSVSNHNLRSIFHNCLRFQFG